MIEGKHMILIGLPGSGKTTVGGQAAELLSLPFTDLDAVIEREVGESIPRIFALYGEAYFRQVESAALRRLLQCPARVIATGGGAVLQEENRTMMQRSGYVFFLDRRVENIIQTLDFSTHPTLRGITLAEMAQQRRSFYLSCADEIIQENDVEQTAAQCAALWRKRYEVSHSKRP